MSKDRKIRNFDFLKEAVSPLPTREEVIQKAAELTGQPTVGEETPSVIAEPEPPVVTPVAAPIVVIEAPPPVMQPIAQPIATEPPVVEAVTEAPKGKAGRKPLEDARKPFTTTITVGNKKKLRQLCAEQDLAMSDVINEILAAYFEERQPSF